jgi:hypothetical protein
LKADADDAEHFIYATKGGHVLVLTVVLTEDMKTYQLNIPFTIED